jgi:hypothetical protein
VDLQTCRIIDSSREIKGSSASALYATQLTYVAGYLSIQTNSFVSMQFPSLSIVREYADVLSNTKLPILSFLSLSYVGGYLQVAMNPVLVYASFPSLTAVVGFLSIRFNPALTYASLPKLTHISEAILFCQNHADFRIPSGPPDAPTGGLVVTGQLKGANSCFFQQGAGTCAPSICP